MIYSMYLFSLTVIKNAPNVLRYSVCTSRCFAIPKYEKLLIYQNEILTLPTKKVS